MVHITLGTKFVTVIIVHEIEMWNILRNDVPISGYYSCNVILLIENNSESFCLLKTIEQRYQTKK